MSTTTNVILLSSTIIKIKKKNNKTNFTNILLPITVSTDLAPTVGGPTGGSPPLSVFKLKNKIHILQNDDYIINIFFFL